MDYMGERMTRKEVNNCFKMEKDTRYIFNNFYRKYNFVCQRTFGKENEKYDCLVKIKNKWWKVEEKMRQAIYRNYQDFLIETIQDTETNSQGWLYKTQAEIILYAFDDETIYTLITSKLRELIDKEHFDIVVSKKGWGNTENLKIPFQTIFDNNVGKLSYVGWNTADWDEKGNWNRPTPPHTIADVERYYNSPEFKK